MGDETLRMHANIPCGTSAKAVGGGTFVFKGIASRVVFGVGAIEGLAAEIEHLGLRRVLVVSGPDRSGRARNIALLLKGRAVGILPRAVMHVPLEIVREVCVEARRTQADAIVAIGGGSATGLAKAIALELSLPIVAVPTTYAGSEVTSIYGITDAGRKATGRESRVQPKTVIYDPALTVGLPVGMSVASGLNAIAHAVEGLYARDGNPIMSLLAEEGIRALGDGLSGVVSDPSDLEARSACLYGAWLCGTVLGSVEMALHHKLCHVLGGTWNLPHAETHAVVLPHAVAYNAASVSMASVSRALEREGSAATALFDLAQELGAPVSLGAIGMPEAALDRAAELTVASPYWNPRAVDREAVRQLLADAWSGRRPTE